MNTTQTFTILAFLFALIISCNTKEESPVSVPAPDYRMAIELVFPNEEIKDSVLNNANLKTALELYHWKNHVVLFGDASDTTELTTAIRDFPLTGKKVYDAPLYAFDKLQHCNDTTMAEEWKDYLLTANLVEDTVLQREYMEYHEHQFEEWPEVSQGFCNANFQQLLVFRTGRQLLLVISIPSERTLDELNPKTTENNPRVDEWNQLMGKYQEGIAGTEEGETWVFLEPY